MPVGRVSKHFSQVHCLSQVSHLTSTKNLTRCFPAYFTDEDTEAKGVPARSLGRIPKQDPERRQVGRLTTSCLTRVG